MAKRVTAKEVNRAGTDWQKQIELYGERSLSTERAFQKYQELKTIWEQQNGKVFGAMKNPRERGFTATQIAELRRAYSGINAIDPAKPTYHKLIARLDAMTQPQLKQLAGANIQFVSSLARNRVRRKNPRRPTRKRNVIRARVSHKKHRALSGASYLRQRTRSAVADALRAKPAELQARISFAQGILIAASLVKVISPEEYRALNDELKQLL